MDRCYKLVELSKSGLLKFFCTVISDDIFSIPFVAKTTNDISSVK